MQLDAPLRSKELASLPVRAAATLGDLVQGTDPTQPALQLAWEDPGELPHSGAQLNPPGGSPHVLAVAPMVEATGDIVPAGDHPGAARDQHAEEDSQSPGAGRKGRRPSSSQYRCASHQVNPYVSDQQYSASFDCQHRSKGCASMVALHHTTSRIPLLTCLSLCRGVSRNANTGHFEAYV